MSSAYSAGPQHQLFSLSLNSIYRQDATSAASDFMRVEGVPVGGCLAGGGVTRGWLHGGRLHGRWFYGPAATGHT